MRPDTENPAFKNMQLEFFNTCNLSGAPLVEATGKASRQNDRIMNIMKELIKATPFEVKDVYDKLYSEAPITSIRRSLTTLSTGDNAKLEMLDEMKDERQGKPNHYWKVK